MKTYTIELTAQQADCAMRSLQRESERMDQCVQRALPQFKKQFAADSDLCVLTMKAIELAIEDATEEERYGGDSMLEQILASLSANNQQRSPTCQQHQKPDDDDDTDDGKGDLLHGCGDGEVGDDPVDDASDKKHDKKGKKHA